MSGSGAGSAAGRARAPRDFRPLPPPSPPSATGPPSHSPRRRPCRPPACPRPSRRSTRTRPDAADTSSSRRGRRAACARRSTRAEGRRVAGFAERRRSLAGRQGNVRAAMEAVRKPDDIRDVNTRYHDVAAAGYDSKWGIDFGEVGQAQVLGKLRKLLGSELDGGYERSLEIGAGTGYFSLNLLQAGIVSEATCTDISPGMVSALATNAERLGVDVRAARAD